MNDERVRFWARFLLGTIVLGWQLYTQQYPVWLVLLDLWLLGGPIEQMVTLFTSGRIQINVRQQQPPPVPPPAPARPPLPAPDDSEDAS